MSETSQFSIQNLEKQRYGILVGLLLVVGCLGGIAVGVGALTQVFSLITLVIVTMASLSMMLAVAPMKIIIYTGITAIIADVIIITINLVA